MRARPRSDPATPRLLPTSLPLPERRGRPEEPPAPRPLPGPGWSPRPARLRRSGGTGPAPAPRRGGDSATPAAPRSDMGRALSLLLLPLALLAAPARAEGGTAAAEEVQIEVLHLPDDCSPKSKKGDLLNAHYDGFLASDGSKFYCRWAPVAAVGDRRWALFGGMRGTAAPLTPSGISGTRGAQFGARTERTSVSNFTPSQPLFFLSRLLKDAEFSVGSGRSAEAKDGNRRWLCSRLAAHASHGDPLWQGGKKALSCCHLPCSVL